MVIYEDEYWTIEIVNDNDYNPMIRISSFEDCHFIDDLELTRQMFKSMVLDDVKDLTYR